jgi:hypothetical protein
MKVQINAQAYHLRYLPEEDRILLSVGVPPGRAFGVVLTRRFTRFLLEALAKIAGERGRVPAGANPVLRDTLLDFEHSQAVANAVAEGQMRDEKREEPLAMPPKLIRQLTIAPKNNGALALVFDDPDQLLTIDVGPDRLHMVIETFVRMSERAGWDFPPLAGWLDAAKNAGAAASKTLN